MLNEQVVVIERMYTPIRITSWL